MLTHERVIPCVVEISAERINAIMTGQTLNAKIGNMGVDEIRLKGEVTCFAGGQIELSKAGLMAIFTFKGAAIVKLAMSIQ